MSPLHIFSFRKHLHLTYTYTCTSGDLIFLQLHCLNFFSWNIWKELQNKCYFAFSSKSSVPSYFRQLAGYKYFRQKAGKFSSKSSPTAAVRQTGPKMPLLIPRKGTTADCTTITTLIPPPRNEKENEKHRRQQQYRTSLGFFSFPLSHKKVWSGSSKCWKKLTCFWAVVKYWQECMTTTAQNCTNR